MILAIDIGNSNIVMALIATALGVAAVIALSYVKFRREELK